MKQTALNVYHGIDICNIKKKLSPFSDLHMDMSDNMDLSQYMKYVLYVSINKHNNIARLILINIS